MITSTPKSSMPLLIDAIMLTLKLSKKRSGVILGSVVATYGFSTVSTQRSIIHSLIHIFSCVTFVALAGYNLSSLPKI